MTAHFVTILGAGAWGTALAIVAARKDRAISLWSRDPAHTATMFAKHENVQYLPGVRLSDRINPTADPRCVAHADIVLAAVPAQSLRSLLSALPRPKAGTPVVICAKGIEQASGSFLSDVVDACLPENPPAALSGPSFAVDVARGRPTAITIAARDAGLARSLAEDLGLPTFRLYHSDDLVGVEVGGAAKNVLAIACGIAAGLGLGASASAALIARGFAELVRFGLARGARLETLTGLSGLGDLVLTCSTAQSRNFALGQALGQGTALAEAMAGKLAEGVATAAVLCRLAKIANVDMPIARSVAAILAGDLTPAEAVENLLSRVQKAEGAV